MNKNNLLLQTADILEKTAEYIEQSESEKVAAEQKVKQQQATTLAEKISAVTGEPVDVELATKLASTAPEIQGILDKLTGEGTVESMGGPDTEVTKVAHASGGIGSAEESFLNFLMS